MSPLEALEVVGLEPGKPYAAAQVDQAVSKADILALNRFRHSHDPKEQEQARQTLALVKEAERVLKGCTVGGVLNVKPLKSASGVSTRKVPGRPQKVGAPSAAATPQGRPSAAPRPSATPVRVRVSQVWPMVLKALRATGDLLFFFWWALTIPVRLFVQRKLVAFAVSFLLVSGVLWCSWTFLTGGALGVSQTVESVSGWVNNTLAGLIEGHGGKTEQRANQEKTRLILEIDQAMELRLDGKPVLPGRDSALLISNGEHSIELRRRTDGQRVYSGTLCFPAGGSLRVVCQGTKSGHPDVALDVQARPPY
jgi:hypothetical protein